MGEVMTFKAALELLRQENPGDVPGGMLEQYADLFATYAEATANIARCGSVVAHPKNGAPVNNPYLAVRHQTLGALRGLPEVKSSRLWAALVKELERTGDNVTPERN